MLSCQIIFQLRRFGIVLLTIAMMGMTITADAAVTVEPVTWNIIGLDSNDVNSGPNVFPIGVRVCNTDTSTITNYRTRFVWDTTSSYITLTSDLDIDIPVLASGSCQDVFYEITITRDTLAYDQAARYHIDVLDSGLTIVDSTPIPRELYVEYLISQNRNGIDDIIINGTSVTPGSGSYAMNEGQTYTIKLVAHTATQGYEQFEQFLTLDPELFTIKNVTATYTSVAGTDPQAESKLYADGCGWINDPTDPLYRDCVGTGKYGGQTTLTYVVQVNIGAATARPTGEIISGLLYDFSGSSYHYNSDQTDSITINFTDNVPLTEVDLGISKVGELSSPGNGVFTLTVTNNSNYNATGVVVTDNVPDGYNIKNVNSQPAPPAGTMVNFVTTNPESVTWTINDLAAGQSISYGFEVQTVNNQTNYVNQACISGNEVDPNSANDCSEAQVPVEQADLAISKTVTYTSPLKIGDSVIFNIDLVNIGPNDATGVVIQDTLPSGYTFVSSSCAAGWTKSGIAPQTICTANADVAYVSGASATTILTINATVNAPADPTNLSNFNNIVSVTSTSNDPVSANNSANSFAQPTFLTIVKTSNSNSYDSTVTSNGVFTLTVTKNGAATDLGTISVTDNLPPGVNVTSMTGTGWTCNTNSVSCTRADNFTSGGVIPAPGQNYPPINVNVSFSGPSNPNLINRGSVISEVGGTVTSFDETLKSVSWINSVVYYTISASAVPTAGGAASCSPSPVTSGSNSTCTATPNSGYVFSGWTGDCAAETTNTCSLTNITSDKISVAQFTQVPITTYNVTATVDPTAGGAASCSPSPVTSGSNSTCTATPNSGYVFSGWTGDCAAETTNTCSLTNITTDKVSVAQFTQTPTINTYTVTASVDPTVGGAASCSPSPVTSGSNSTCTATPNSGYVFSGWTGDCAAETTNTCSLTNITSDKVSVAYFQAARPIPTLSQWMLYLLSALLVTTGVISMRKNVIE